MTTLRTTLASTFVFLCGCGHAAPASNVPMPSAEGARCAVWNREVSFAKSVRDHDAAAFGEHVLEGAVFVETDETLRGRTAVVKGWEPLLRGDGVRLDWHPSEVVVTSDPHVAMSRGPVWIEVTKPDKTTKLLVGSFQSTWVFDHDGVWRVAVDGGETAKEVTAEEMAKLKAATPAECPAETR